MRSISPVKMALAGASVAALTVGGAYAADTVADDGEPAAVVNKNGHEVDEHAADGQARAAEARAAAEARRAATDADEADEEADEEADDEATEAPESDEVAPEDDNGNHGGPDEHAGDHPAEQAFLNPQPHEPQGPKDDHTDNAGGLGPDEHAGDHPDDHASASTEERGSGRSE